MRNAMVGLVFAVILSSCGNDPGAVVRALAVDVSANGRSVTVTTSYPLSVSCAKEPGGVEIDLDGSTAIVTARVKRSGDHDICSAECATVTETVVLDAPLPDDVTFESSPDAEPGCMDAPSGPIVVPFPTAIYASDLTEDRPCTNRFQVGSTNDQILLTVEWRGEYLESPAGQISELDVDLPDANWIGYLQVGSHLSAQVLCTDVLTEDDLRPRIDHRVEVSGQLVIHSLPSEPGGPAEASLLQAVIEHSDGTKSRIDLVALRNRRFSYFAG